MNVVTEYSGRAKVIFSTESYEAVSGRRSKRRYGLALFFFVFLAIGSVILFLAFLRPMYYVWSAKSWIETPCVILASKVESHSGDNSTTYSVEVVFEYEVDGHQYQSERYDLWNISSSGREARKKIVARIPPGTKTHCYVNPDDFEFAVLERGYSSMMWFGLFPLPFVLIGGGGMLFSLGVVRVPWKRRAQTINWKPAGVRSTSSIAETESYPHEMGDSTAGHSPVTLRPESTRIGAFICVVIIAVIWNTFVGFFFLAALRAGEGRFPKLIMIPFVLAGVGIVVYAGYTFLRLFNPKPTLTLSNGAIPLGESITLDWQMSGNVNSIQWLSIALHAEEQATYTRGTNTYTDKDTFFEQTLFETDRPEEILSGSTELQIPAHSMHSFQSPHKKIVWSSKVHGDIRRWPDVKQTFPVVVLPRQLEGSHS